MTIEPLESRIAPAILINPADPRLATYTDVDGDEVIIKVSKGEFAAANFASEARGLGEQLLLIDLHEGGFDDANLIVRVVKARGGDGLAHIGAIDSTGHDLGRVVIPGDLGVIIAGDAVREDGGMQSLFARSMGRYGLATQLFGVTLRSQIDGDLGTLKIAGDIKEARVLVFAGSIDRVEIGGSLIGGEDNASGVLHASFGFGTITIGGDIIGGAGTDSGKISTTLGGDIASLNVKGSIVGGNGGNSGEIVCQGDLGPVIVGGNLRGGLGVGSGTLFAHGMSDVRVGGSVIGGGELLSGAIQSRGDIGAVHIAHNAAGNAGIGSGSILADGSIKSVTIGGSLHGDVGSNSGRIRALKGDIGPIKIGGNVQSGGGEESGKIGAGGKIASLVIGGSLIGGVGRQDTFTDDDGVLHKGQVFAGGSVGPIKIARNLIGGDGNSSGGIRALGDISAITIGGSMVGGVGDFSASIVSDLDIGQIKIGHDVKGGAGAETGSIYADKGIENIRVGGSLFGGFGLNSGRFSSDATINSVAIAGDVIGGAENGAGVVRNAAAVTLGGSLVAGTANFTGLVQNRLTKLESLRIGHDIVGGSNGDPFIEGILFSGAVTARRIGDIVIGGSIIAGRNVGTTLIPSIGADLDIDSITVKGGLIGNGDGEAVSRVTITAGGGATSGALTDVAIGKISIGGRVERAQILAGYDASLIPVNADAQIGSVKVGGDWIASSVVAGAINLGPDGMPGGIRFDNDTQNFGNADDTKIPEANESPEIVASIGRILITGEIFGTAEKGGNNPGDSFGFVAEEIGGLKVGARKISLAAGDGNDGVPLGFFTEAIRFDMALHELGESIAVSMPSLVPAAKLVDARTVVYTDSDGDRVTVKLSEPLLTTANANLVFTFDNGSVGGPDAFPQQLQVIDLAPLATPGLDVKVTVQRVDGDGLSQIGTIRALGIDVGQISIAGDLGSVRAGEDSTRPGVESIKVRSMGRLGIDTQPDTVGGFLPDLRSFIGGTLGSLKVQRDVTGAYIDSSVHVGPVTIGGSLIGGSGLGIIVAAVEMGRVKIGEHLQAGAQRLSGQILANDILSLTIGGSVIGDAEESAVIMASLGQLGPVKVRHNLIGGGTTPVTLYGDNGIADIAIAGSFLAPSGGAGARVTTNGNIDSVHVGLNLIGGPAYSGHIDAASIGAITIGGSVVGGSGNNTGEIRSNDGDIGSVKIGHDLHGGGDADSGRISAAGKLGPVSIGGSVWGGVGERSGWIEGGASIASVAIAHDLKGVGLKSGILQTPGNFGGLTIGGSLLGNVAEFTGSVFATGGIDSLRIGGDIVGGTSKHSGYISTENSIDRLTLGGSLFGGGASGVSYIGAIFAAVDLGKTRIGHDVIGGAGAQSGWIQAGVDLESIVIGGSLIGGHGGNSGAILSSSGDIGSVKIGHDLVGASIKESMAAVDLSAAIESRDGRIGTVIIGGSIVSGIDASTEGDLTRNATIRAGADLGTLIVKGSLVGNVTTNGESRVIISARGQEVLGTNNDVAIGRILVRGHVEWANIFAGYTTFLGPMPDSVQVGTVKVGRDWVASNLIAGVGNLGMFAEWGEGLENRNFGDELDVRTTDENSVNRIASITISGSVIGTAEEGDHFGFSAFEVRSFRSINFNAPLTAGGSNDLLELSPTTADVSIRET